MHASLTGLEPDTAYFYRLHAKNEHGANPGEASETYRFTTPGPGLHGESVSDVSSSSATFEATIAPHDAPTGRTRPPGAGENPDVVLLPVQHAGHGCVYRGTGGVYERAVLAGERRLGHRRRRSVPARGRVWPRTRPTTTGWWPCMKRSRKPNRAS